MLRNLDKSSLHPSKFELCPQSLPPKWWRGSPIAALARTFYSMGSQEDLLPEDALQELRSLKALHRSHGTEGSFSAWPHMEDHNCFKWGP